jgi:hypothetical protein
MYRLKLSSAKNRPANKSKAVDGDLAVRKDCHHDMHVVRQANIYKLPPATGQTLSHAKIIKPIAWVICEHGTNRRNIAPLLPIVLTPKQTVAALGNEVCH